MGGPGKGQVGAKYGGRHENSDSNLMGVNRGPNSPLREDNFLVSRDGIVVPGNAPGLPAIVEGKTGPDRYVPTFIVLIPTSAAAGLPNRRLQPFLDLPVGIRLGVGVDVGRLQMLPSHEAEATHDVFDLRLDHDDNRVVAETSIGTEQHEEIRESADADAVIARNLRLPGRAQADAVASRD